MTVIDNSTIEDNSIKISDICIVGSGMSAQIIASNLQNKKVVMVESGKSGFEKKIQNLNEYDEEGIPFRENHANRIRQLGGSANLWANQLMALKKNELKNRDWVTKDFSWPFEYDELKLHYEQVIKTVYEKRFKNFNYLNPIHENKRSLFLENEFLKTGEFEFQNSFWPSNVEKFNQNSKLTKKILSSKNLEFLEFFTATDFEIDEATQTIISVKIQSENKTCKIKSKLFVLASGALENARILLNNEKNSKLFKNYNTGKFFMDHPRVSLGILKSKKKLPLSLLFGIKYTDYDFKKSIQLSEKYRNDNKIINAHAYLDPKFNHDDELIFESFLKELKKIVKLKGLPKINLTKLNLRKIFEQVYLKLSPQISNSTINSFLRKIFEGKNYFLSFDKMEINYQAEQFPNIDSRVYLSDKKDNFNHNKLVINWKLNDIDHKSLNEFLKVLNKNYKSHHFLSFDENLNKKITDASHHSGTTRMSLDRSDGVVDKNCKFHDIKNLYISGGSVFRSAGSVNPGLTNMAMSMRLGKHLEKIKQ